jgi:hypothetical protein
MTRRTGPHHVDLPSDAPSSEGSPSSQDATTSQEPASSQEFASPRRVVKEIVESDGPSHALERWVTKYNKNRDENIKWLSLDEQAEVEKMKRDILVSMDVLYDIVYCAKDRNL